MKLQRLSLGHINELADSLTYSGGGAATTAKEKPIEVFSSQGLEVEDKEFQ